MANAYVARLEEGIENDEGESRIIMKLAQTDELVDIQMALEELQEKESKESKPRIS